MAEQEQVAEQQQMIAPFPAPPPFYKHFTKSNIKQLRQLRKDGCDNDGTARTNGGASNGASKQDLDILSLPPQLRYLIPPQPSTSDELTVFGIPVSVENKQQTLADRGVEQLYPDHESVHKNPQPQLIALARSLLTTFLSLLGVLSENPSLYDERVEALRQICENMHALINAYRPHQARETLILMMEERVERRREEIRKIEEGRVKTEEIWRKLNTDAEEAGAVGLQARGSAVKGERKDMLRQKSAWESLEQDMGEY